MVQTQWSQLHELYSIYRNSDESTLLTSLIRLHYMYCTPWTQLHGLLERVNSNSFHPNWIHPPACTKFTWPHISPHHCLHSKTHFHSLYYWWTPRCTFIYLICIHCWIVTPYIYPLCTSPHQIQVHSPHISTSKISTTEVSTQYSKLHCLQCIVCNVCCVISNS